MPDWVFPFPFPVPGGGGDGPAYPGIGPLVDEFLRRYPRPAPASPPAEAEPPASPGLPLPLPSLPEPSVPPLPTLTADILLSTPAPATQALLLRGRRSSREAEGLVAREDEAYGRRRVKLRKARRMARRRSTMRAQEDVFTPIDPRSLPVPQSVPSPKDFQDAIDNEARQRATDEDVRRRARERGATPAPNRAPPRTRGGRGRVGVGAIFDPFSIAEDFGIVAGEEAGEALYGRTPEEEAEAARLERELRERTAELDRQMGDIGTIPRRRAPPATPRGIEAYGAVSGFPKGIVRPFPTMPPAAPPAPKRSRVGRALHQIQRVTSNPWAQLGVFGLGLLGGRKRSRPTLPLAPAVEDEPLAPPLTGFNAGALPFVQGMPSLGGAPPVSRSDTGCDCKPKRRGPKRRCLERAQVAWRSGRYKGKLAGTRCVRWE